MREEAGYREGAESLARRAAAAGDTGALTVLVRMREEAGDREGAETLACRAAAAGDTGALAELARLRHWAGERKGAEILYRQLADAGKPVYGSTRIWWLYGLDPDGSPTPPWQ
ncbi:hypothetical protein C3492_43215 [Streptomyces sp. Ru62]|nr:hypothetical protein C3492_43215 [Streptomyces sp. Ru62]